MIIGLCIICKNGSRDKFVCESCDNKLRSGYLLAPPGYKNLVQEMQDALLIAVEEIDNNPIQNVIYRAIHRAESIK